MKLFNERDYRISDSLDRTMQELKRLIETKELAYFLWEKAGKPEGRDLEFWLKAERIINGKVDRTPYVIQPEALEFGGQSRPYKD